MNFFMVFDYFPIFCVRRVNQEKITTLQPKLLLNLISFGERQEAPITNLQIGVRYICQEHCIRLSYKIRNISRRLNAEGRLGARSFV